MSITSQHNWEKKNACEGGMGFPGGAGGKELARQSLGREDPLEEGTETHSTVLAWRIPWTEEPGGLQSLGS